MKLTLAQALATVLNIKQDGERYFMVSDGVEIPLDDKLDDALEKAVQICNKDKECAFAIFPIGSEREGFYMEIERELLRQEAMPDMQGHKAWESFGTDPRKAIEMMMETARLAACNLTVPPVYRQQLLRFACVAVAALQWCDKWIEKLTALAKDPDLGNRIIRPAGLEQMSNGEAMSKAHAEPPSEYDCGVCGRRLEDCECAKQAQEENS